MTAYLIAVGEPPAALVGWWPIVWSVLGALIVGGVSVYGWGKWTQSINGFTKKVEENLNGFGTRLKTAEDRIGYADARDLQLQQNIDRVLAEHSNILEKLGEAKRGVEGCSAEMEDSTRRIEVKIDSVRDTLNKIDKDLSGRITALEATGRRLHHEN